ncbi:MAG: hypothetical protein ABJF86_08245 [Tateyamaria sp.]|uniref:hypothetical protein n=1 Tax=Tateyamaria sp. TaxID=1929288 RepID=UPI0032786573
MTRFLFHLGLALAVVWLPYGAWACDYSAPMRLISATLSSVQDTGGRVSPYHRARLRQALQRMDVTAVEREMKGTLGRADQRAALATLTLSSALVNGSGWVLDGRDVAYVKHLANAIRTSCLADTNAKAQNTATDATLEQGDPQVGNGGASGLTFRQGIARLSLTFTIYMTFLALVIGLRRGRNSPVFSVPTDDGPPPGARAFSPRMANEISDI